MVRQEAQPFHKTAPVSESVMNATNKPRCRRDSNPPNIHFSAVITGQDVELVGHSPALHCNQVPESSIWHIPAGILLKADGCTAAYCKVNIDILIGFNHFEALPSICK